MNQVRNSKVGSDRDDDNLCTETVNGFVTTLNQKQLKRLSIRVTEREPLLLRIYKGVSILVC